VAWQCFDVVMLYFEGILFDKKTKKTKKKKTNKKKTKGVDKAY